MSQSRQGKRLGEDGLQNNTVPFEVIGDWNKKVSIKMIFVNRLGRGGTPFRIVHHR